ncbi:MAG: OsmC family protein [Myxococcota bacterium]
MKVTLRRIDGAHFEATNEAGLTCQLDGPPDLGGKGAGVRPMEMVLMSLAGCSALDVLHILQKQRQGLQDLNVEVDGQRADAVPAVFTTIHLRFVATGEVEAAKLERAVELSMEKYCSVAHMLQAKVEITHSAEVKSS